MKIKKIPKIISFFCFRSLKGFALFHNIYLADKYFRIHVSEIHDTEVEALIAHESEHTKRNRTSGVAGLLKYLSHPKYRLQEELAATKAEISIYNRDGKTFDCEKRARSWSSINYGWMIDYEEALYLLREIS